MKYLNLIQDHDNISSVKPEWVNVIRCLDDDHVHYNKINNNGYEYVDLGLPSGTLWATCNVGASSPEDKGDFFAWGEVEPKYTSLNPITWKDGVSNGYSWDSYKWGTKDNITKYNETDSKLILDPEDDAAHVNWGGDWKMPTSTQVSELFNNCTKEVVTLNGTSGIKFTSNTDGYLNKFIFIPYSGYIEYSNINNINTSNLYWWCKNRVGYKYNLAIGGYWNPNNTGYINYNYDRNTGYPIRPVIQFYTASLA